MSDSRRQEILTELKDAVQSGTMAINLRDRAEKLLLRISSPIRLTIMGLPESGKSTLANLLLGEYVLHEGNNLPTVQFKSGDQPKTSCTMPDGTKLVFDHCNSQEIDALNPILLEMELPLPALKKIDLMVLFTDDQPSEMKRAMQWAFKRTDIAVWCTQGFAQDEQSLWDEMSETQKDHVFLLITKADILASQGVLGETKERLKQFGDGYFKRMLSIDTKGAVAAKSDDGSIDKKAMADTGGAALISAILREVDEGVQSACDEADILLRQHHQFAQSMPQPKQDEPEIELEQPSVTNQSTVADVVEEPTAETTKINAAVETPSLKPRSRSACVDAIVQLSNAGAEMIEIYDDDQVLSADEIMRKSSENVTWLTDHLQQRGDASDPLLQRAIDDATDASDLLQLLELEDGDDASSDALSVVVQLKRDLETIVSV